MSRTFPITLLKLLRLPIVLSFLAVVNPSSAATPQCYFINGDQVTNNRIVPCDPSATGLTPGSHSACCNQQTGDACLSTGLCLGTWGKTPSQILWINGCTDKTWKDPSCPQYCNPAPNSTADTHNPGLKACGDKTFCCAGAYSDEAECCQNSFTLGRNVGTVVRLLATTADSGNSGQPSSGTGGPSPSSPASNQPAGGGGNDERKSSGGPNVTAAAVTGGVLGSLLLAVSTALALVVVQKRKLQKLWDEKCREPFPKLRTSNDDGRGGYYGVQVTPQSRGQHNGSEWTVTEMPTGENRINQLP
ncbi:hypothetical protein QBC44DRAFT_368640 [Cladorrhinum sp. PSN332]|nr:hypothetical protein QBC44DRAFT_368640 [Cladorrhinum sp. PSN332]